MAKKIAAPAFLARLVTCERFEHGDALVAAFGEVVDAQAGAAGQQGSFPTAQVETRETGIILRATPHVTESGKITLQLRAERSAAVLAESDAGFIFQQQYAESRVIVEDGETVVIGGLIENNLTETESKVPIFGDLPVVGQLFRTNADRQRRAELLIVITATVVRAEEDAYRLSVV